MNNKDTILRLLQSNPRDEFTNSDIVSRTKITPHQQVFQITRHLRELGEIHGEKRGKEWYFRATGESILSTRRKTSYRQPASGQSWITSSESINWQSLIDDFVKVANLAGAVIQNNAIVTETLPAPHEPPRRLPQGKLAVYIFSRGAEVLKVGKAGHNSEARYTSQHYNPRSARSTLAASILQDEDIAKRIACDERTMGNWMKSNLDRTNILLEQRFGVSVLTLLEVFLQCRLKPKYEGFKSQRNI
jgi:hypothetical protein